MTPVRSIPDLVQDLSGGNLQVLGQLGTDNAGIEVLLAKDATTGKLLALRLQGHQRDAGTAAGLATSPYLDESVPGGSVTCRHCKSVSDGWRRYCLSCGTDMTAGGVGLSHMPAAEVAETLKSALGTGYEYLGDMDRVAGTGAVAFARESDTGQLFAVIPSEVEAPGGHVRSTEVFRLGNPSPEKPGANTEDDQHPLLCPFCGVEYSDKIRYCPQDATLLVRKRPSADFTGRVVAGRYHVQRQIGEGGMGHVYLAEHIQMGRQCALKIMKSGLTTDAESLRRFRREANNASKILHANVAIIYDCGETEDGDLFIAMEYVEGRSLSAVMAEEAPLTIARACAIATQIASALAAAHRIGIIHRDLKPQNILLTRNAAGEDVIKVVDFGIAKSLQDGGQTVTRTGFVVGTPRFMSPEQMMAEAVDHRSDLYSLGCILYEMLLGTPPYDDGLNPGAFARRLVEAPPHPRTRRADVPAELDALIVRALARSPAARFQSAQELAAALTMTPASAAPFAWRSKVPWLGRARSQGLPPAGQTPSQPVGRIEVPARVNPTPAAAPAAAPPTPAQRRVKDSVARAVGVRRTEEPVAAPEPFVEPAPADTPPQAEIGIAPTPAAARDAFLAPSGLDSALSDAVMQGAALQRRRPSVVQWGAMIGVTLALAALLARNVYLKAPVPASQAAEPVVVLSPPAPAPARVAIESSEAGEVLSQALRLNVGDSLQLAGAAFDSVGSKLAAPALKWETSDERIVTISSSGQLTARSSGSAELKLASGPAVTRVRVHVAAGEAAPAKVAAPAPTQQPRSPPAATPAAPVAGATGFLVLHVRPWGRVLIDGKEIDNGARGFVSYPLPAGPHRLLVENPSYGRRELPIDIPENDSLPLQRIDFLKEER